MTIRELQEQAYENSKAHGFYDEERGVPEAIALMHSELSEALECYRDGLAPGKVDIDTRGPNAGKPEGFGIELADAMIRIADTAHSLGVDLEAMLAMKMNYNKSRPYKHGKVC